MNNEKFFSIIIPAYNVEKYIQATVYSVLNQSFNDYEIIIVNDGSTDRTKEYCEIIKKEYNDKIILINKTNEGVSKSRNVGLKNANGKYILFLDGDDMLKQGLLEKLSSIISETGSDFVYFDFVEVEEKKEVNLSINHDNKYMMCDKVACFTEKMQERIIPCFASCIQRKMIESNNISFNEELYYVEDANFFFECLKCAQSVIYYPEKGYIYLQRYGSATHTKYIPYYKAITELDGWYNIKKLVDDIDDSVMKLVNNRIFEVKYRLLFNLIETYTNFQSILSENEKNQIYKFVKEYQCISKQYKNCNKIYSRGFRGIIKSKLFSISPYTYVMIRKIYNIMKQKLHINKCTR